MQSVHMWYSLCEAWWHPGPIHDFRPGSFAAWLLQTTA